MTDAPGLLVVAHKAGAEHEVGLPSMMGSTRRSSSSGLYCPSASRLMTIWDFSACAMAKPVLRASPCPRLTTWLTTGTPSALAMSAVLSAEPSSTTTVLTS